MKKQLAFYLNMNRARLSMVNYKIKMLQRQIDKLIGGLSTNSMER